MLGEITQYGATMAKIRVMRSRMLTDADYRALMDKHTVGEAAAYLKNNTCYSDVLSDVNEQDIHRDRLEALLNAAFVRDAKKIYRFENGDNRKFYQYIFLKNEIECLKLMLRLLDTGELSEDSFEVSGFYKRHFTIDIDRLKKSASIREFISNLRGSRYEQVVAPLLRMEEHQNLFSVEMTLDLYYFSVVNKRMEKLKNKKDRALLEYTMGTEGDLLNILWIYRCKKYYDIPREIIYAFVIPNHYKVGVRMIRAMVEAPGEAQLLALIAQTPYADAFRKSDGQFYERSYYHYVYRLHKQQYKKHPFSIAAAIAFFHFKEIEIRNITSIIEGIRYGLAPGEIAEYVVGLEEQAG